MADPTRGQGRVLAILKLQPEISTKDLSYLLGIRQQSLNELLNKLEKGGYVTRVPSEEDRRVMLVRLAEKGRDEQQEGADLSGIFSCLSAEEQAEFGKYLDCVIDALGDQLGSDEDEGTYDWKEAARRRMGDEQFDRLMSMRGKFGGMRGNYRHGHFGCGFYGAGPDRCGPMTGGDATADERFDPDYDDSIPEGRNGFPFGEYRDEKKPPRKDPHDTEDK